VTTILIAAYAAVALLLFVVALTNLCWMLEAWRSPAGLDATGFRQLDEPQLTFSLIVPARHEEAVLERTIESLCQLDHPGFEIIVVIGHEDEATYDVARRAAARHPDQVGIVIDENWPKNKPKALNSALPYCRADIVGVFDAEDSVAPTLLRYVDASFRANDAHVVQGGVQLMNYRSNWFAVRNVMEYYFWFRSRLHFHARQRFIPLGGNTVFVRRDLLQQVGGWDPECLAEDCELGVRLSSMGARVAVAYDPALVTREETPATLKQLFRQRTRWNQGFLQVLRKGEWRKLPTLRQRLLARFTLWMPFLQAFAGLMIPVAILTAFLVKAPVGLVLLAYASLLPLAVTIVVECAGLHEFCRSYGTKARLLDYLRLVIGTPLYQAVLGAAAVRAAARELRGRRGWEKTTHIGAHRSLDDLEPGVREAVA